MTDKRTIWESALVPGLAVAAVPVAYSLICWVLSDFFPDAVGEAVFTSIVVVLLWLGKVTGGIMLLRFFMKRFATDNGSDVKEAFRFGLAVSFLSSLIFAGFYMAYLKFLVPDTIQTVFDAIKGQLSEGGLSSDSLEQLKAALPTLPRRVFFIQLIYGFCFGTFLSAIISKKIIK